MLECFRIIAEGVGPDGTQLADERKRLLRGFVNMLDAQTQRLHREADRPTSVAIDACDFVRARKNRETTAHLP